MAKYEEITLAWHEYAMASEIGRLRQLASVRRNLPDKHGFTGLGWSEHIEGACGELVVCKFLGMYWDGSIDTFKKPDIGERLQVRTGSAHNKKLIVRPPDPIEDIYICVTGKCPTYRINGFIHGQDAKKQEYLEGYGDRPAAYFVPHNVLAPIQELKALVNL